jgi:seryl-tRNA synthetase
MCVHLPCTFQIPELAPPQKIARRLEIEQQEMVKTGLEACQVETDSECLDTKSEDMMVEINEALTAYTDANHKFLSAKEVSKEKLNESRDRLEAASEEVQGLFQTLQNVCDVLRTVFASANVHPPGGEAG